MNSKEENSEGICPNYVQEFGLRTGCSTEDHLLSIIGKEEKGGDQDMMCLLQLTVTARDSIYCPVEGRGGGEEEASSTAQTVTPG